MTFCGWIEIAWICVALDWIYVFLFFVIFEYFFFCPAMRTPACAHPLHPFPTPQRRAARPHAQGAPLTAAQVPTRPSATRFPSSSGNALSALPRMSPRTWGLAWSASRGVAIARSRPFGSSNSRKRRKSISAEEIKCVRPAARGSGDLRAILASCGARAAGAGGCV